jgi:hypothetical protein
MKTENRVFVWIFLFSLFLLTEIFIAFKNADLAPQRLLINYWPIHLILILGLLISTIWVDDIKAKTVLKNNISKIKFKTGEFYWIHFKKEWVISHCVVDEDTIFFIIGYGEKFPEYLKYIDQAKHVIMTKESRSIEELDKIVREQKEECNANNS